MPANQEIKAENPADRITEEDVLEIQRSGFPNTELVEYKVTPGATTGDNFMCDLFCVDLTLRSKEGKKLDAKQEQHLMVKIPSLSPMWQAIVKAGSFFFKETLFYKNVAPAIRRAQIEAGVDPSEVISPVASTYFIRSESTADGRQPILAMQNLKALDFSMVKNARGLDLEHVKLVVKELARFHAFSILLKRDLKVPIQEKYKGLLPETFLGESGVWFGNLLGSNLPYIEKVLAMRIPNYEQIKPRVFKEGLFSISKEIIPEVREPYGVIGHGDCWFNNFMFRYEVNEDGREVPTEVKLVDWQLVRYGSPSLDLSYCIYTSTSVKMRKNHLLNILKTYHTTFVQTLNRLGEDTTPYTFQLFLEDWERVRKYGFTIGFLFGFVMKSPKDSMPQDNIGADMVEDAGKNQTLFGDLYGAMANNMGDELEAMLYEAIENKLI